MRNEKLRVNAAHIVMPSSPSAQLAGRLTLIFSNPKTAAALSAPHVRTYTNSFFHRPSQNRKQPASRRVEKRPAHKPAAIFNKHVHTRIIYTFPPLNYNVCMRARGITIALRGIRDGI